MKNKAFTLIEVLIVVLIIAILAAIAVPQYKKAIYKSKFTSIIPIVENIAKAEDIYFISNGVYTKSLEDLDIELPEFSIVTSESTSTINVYRNTDNKHKNRENSIEITISGESVSAMLRGYGGNSGPSYIKYFENTTLPTWMGGYQRQARNWGKEAEFNEWDNVFQSMNMTNLSLPKNGWHIWGVGTKK